MGRKIRLVLFVRMTSMAISLSHFFTRRGYAAATATTNRMERTTTHWTTHRPGRRTLSRRIGSTSSRFPSRHGGGIVLNYGGKKRPAKSHSSWSAAEPFHPARAQPLETTYRARFLDGLVLQQQQQQGRVCCCCDATTTTTRRRFDITRRFFWRGGGGGSSSTDWSRHHLNKKTTNAFGVPLSKIATTDVSSRYEYAPAIALRKPHNHPTKTNKNVVVDDDTTNNDNNDYPVSVCAVQGLRPDMQDYFVVQNDFIACFDGHGGDSVSRYLRMNLYANLQAALPMVIRTRPTLMDKETDDGHRHHNSNTNTNIHAYNYTAVTSNDATVPNDDDTTTDANDQELYEGTSYTTTVPHSPHNNNVVDPAASLAKQSEHVRAAATAAAAPPQAGVPVEVVGVPSSRSGSGGGATIDDYEAALELALEKVDREVQKIHHWSFQGSTVVACWFHRFQEDESSEPMAIGSNTSALTEMNADAAATAVNSTSVNGRDGSTPTTVASAQDDTIIASRNSEAAEGEINSAPAPPPPPPPVSSSPLTHPKAITTIITANLGDSRAVLCRNGAAIELTRDHKPSDPFENERIHRVGGTVVWSGQIDRHDQPVPGTGEFRINQSLSLSRAIGDRAERPVVSGEPEISIVQLVDDDEFLLLATDGLWDVMSSSDAVAYVRALLENAMDDAAMERDTIAALLVEEALRRNSADNITVMIVWMQKTGPKRPKKFWI